MNRTAVRERLRDAPSVRRVGTWAFEVLGTTSGPLRPPPEFVLIGGKRTGSTSFFYELLENPHVLPHFPPASMVPRGRDGKGVHYFDRNPGRSAYWYRGHFPSVIARRAAESRLSGRVIAGEGSPYYLFHPLAPAGLSSVAPEARLLVLLRDPVIRTYSHWKEQTRNGSEALSFEEALAAEATRSAGEEARIVADPNYRSFAHENQTYAAQSDYRTMLERWFAFFPREQVLVQLSEDYYADRPDVVGQACDFLGIPRHEVARTARVRNAAPGAPIHPDLSRQLASRFADTRQYVSDLLGREVPWTRPF